MRDAGRPIRAGDEIGDFVIEAETGQGGMGTVYRARQKRPDRIVALKVIKHDLATDRAFRDRFEREARIAAKIEHPNVIPVYAVDEDDGVLFIAMRYVEGSDLKTLIDSKATIPPRRAAAIVDQVARALDAAHALGLVHRDVKPANILLQTNDGGDHVYLTDFGLARHIEESQGLTETDGFLGTPDYAAPEQAKAEAVDARADIYALGCVLFHALSGTVPFPRPNVPAKLFAHVYAPQPSVHQRAADVPATFDPVLMQAMAKAPDDRYQSARDLGDAALAAATASGSGSAILDEPTERGPGIAVPDLGVKLANELEKLHDLSRGGIAPGGTGTGFRDLDVITGGFQRGNLIVVAARPSMGKSCLVTNIAENAAIEYGKPVALFSLELSEAQLVQRFVASQARIKGDELRKGRVGESRWPKVIKASQRLAVSPLWIDDSSDTSLVEIREKAQRLHAEHQEGLGLIVIDQLELLRSDHSSRGRDEELAEVIRGLKRLARELDVPVVVICNVDRAVEHRQDRRPRLGDLPTAGAIEQVADLILFIYRDDCYDWDSERPGEADIIISKHRNGPLGIATLSFQPEYPRFMNFTSVARPAAAAPASP